MERIVKATYSSIWYVNDEGEVFRKRYSGLRSKNKPYLKNGSYAVKINNKSYNVAVLVAKSFINDYNIRKHIIKHIDGDISNNKLSNLKLITRSEHGKINCPHPNAWRYSIKEIGKKKVIFNSSREVGKVLGYSFQTIINVVKKCETSYWVKDKNDYVRIKEEEKDNYDNYLILRKEKNESVL